MTTAALLRKAAEALDRQEDPFSGEFLGTNDVTSDQCMTLAEQLAIGARIVAAAIGNPRSEFGVAYALAIAGVAS
jgi:hypothetical protein